MFARGIWTTGGSRSEKAACCIRDNGVGQPSRSESVQWLQVAAEAADQPPGGCRCSGDRDSPTVAGHNCGVTSEPLRSVRDHLLEIVDRVEREHDRVVITRNGRDAAVLVSADDLAELEETLSVLSDPAVLAISARPTAPTPAAMSFAASTRSVRCVRE
jgi:antitoxin YefM